MNKFQKLYDSFNVKNNSHVYKGAEEFARSFKKCTVFEFKRTKTAANTIPTKNQ